MAELCYPPTMRLALIFISLLAACTSTPEQRQQHINTLHDAVRGYAKEMLLTPVAITCRGRSEHMTRCDLHAREAGVLPLKCYDGVCRLLD